MVGTLINTSAYAKIILHAAKYPHCAVNGVLLADASNRSVNKNNHLEILDTVPLFHHSHYLSPMAEVALTQIDTVAQSDNKIIAGYYAACENLNDNTVEKCPGLKIAEKIAESFPAAVFFVLDNKKIKLSNAITVHKYSDGKWKEVDENSVYFENNNLDPDHYFNVVGNLLERGVHKELVDFDNYLDDMSQDWTNPGIDKLVASITASDASDSEDDEESLKDYED